MLGFLIIGEICDPIIVDSEEIRKNLEPMFSRSSEAFFAPTNHQSINGDIVNCFIFYTQHNDTLVLNLVYFFSIAARIYGSVKVRLTYVCRQAATS